MIVYYIRNYNCFQYFIFKNLHNLQNKKNIYDYNIELKN